MTTYTCKCGKTFDTLGSSVTTLNKIPLAEYLPEHECFGCPFVFDWNAEFKACRGTRETPIYGTAASCVTSKASTLHVSSLDFDFIKSMQDFYNSLGVEDPKDPPDPGMEDGSGRYNFSFNFPKNIRGDLAKHDLIGCFFEPVQCKDTYRELYARKDISGCGEQYSLYYKIEKAKEEAKAMAQEKEPTPASRKYYHFNLVYFVDRREDNGQYTVFMDDHQHPGPETVTPCATIPDFDTFEQAQNALDGYAIKRGFTDDPTERPTMEETTTPAETEDDQPDTEEDQNASENDSPDSANEESKITDPDSDDSANDLPEESQEPCNWKNASGADQDDELEHPPAIPTGERVSLRDSAFGTLLDACDEKINRALRMSVDAGQGFSFTAKVAFEPRGCAFGIKYETGYQFDPIKVKDKGELYEEIPIQLDESGNPIIPYDRQHQINFDELQPGREIPPTGTVTVDGKTGIVEGYQEGGEEHEDLPTSDDITNSIVKDDLEGGAPAQLIPCENYDCPFYGAPNEEISGCCFDSEDSDSPDYAGDVWEAVHMHGCQRQEVLDAYRHNDPENDSSAAPDESEAPENNEEDYAS